MLAAISVMSFFAAGVDWTQRYAPNARNYQRSSASPEAALKNLLYRGYVLLSSVCLFAKIARMEIITAGATSIEAHRP